MPEHSDSRGMTHGDIYEIITVGLFSIMGAVLAAAVVLLLAAGVFLLFYLMISPTRVWHIFANTGIGVRTVMVLALAPLLFLFLFLLSIPLRRIFRKVHGGLSALFEDSLITLVRRLHLDRKVSIIGMIAGRSALRSASVALACIFVAIALAVFGYKSETVSWLLVMCGSWNGLDAYLTLQRVRSGVFGDTDYELREVLPALVIRIKKGGRPDDPGRLFPERQQTTQADFIGIPDQVPV